MTTDKTKAIETAVSQIERAFGKGAIMRLGGDQVVEVETISTGSLGLDIGASARSVPDYTLR
jgi:recombination protein RecA